MMHSEHLAISGQGLSPAKKEALLADFFNEMSEKKQNFLGYQTNQDVSFSSSLQPFLSLNLLNLGDGFEDGSYEINAKQFERAVIDYYARLWGFSSPFSPRRYWGHITAMGSTEGNLYALWNARDYLSGYAVEGYQQEVYVQKPPIAIFSEAAHYSIKKACQILGLTTFNKAGPFLGTCPINQGDWQQALATKESGAVKEGDLYKLTEFFVEREYPVILILNHGTTFSGGSDATRRILNHLKPILGTNTEQDRRYWVHLDGALSANFSPYLNDDPFAITQDPYEFRHPDVMSICSSPYKWIGAPWACGIFLMHEQYKVGSSHRPAYIAGRDSTVSGSRQDIYALYLWERLTTLGTQGLKKIALENEHNAHYLHQQLTRLARFQPNITVMPKPNGSNIVRFSTPNDKINRQFSLAQDDVDVKGKTQRMSHVVVLSHVKRNMIDALLHELSSPYAFKNTQIRQHPLTVNYFGFFK
ncbi:Histidine decarboxylase [Marinomonas spartinae]|uniref:pyridoxal-dependent decarboxylase n=1 Tax=Marinomonas spartinae TaxID=1792290 RepID=UPI000808FD0A|nr:pyridoxal-dependent decarboxylase [Marinomonas spartinae]SBS31072.1 Histidine decarboxylase [Marinomonas spartinae]